MDIRTVHQLRASARGRRIELGLSQAAVAERAGVSRKWLSDFESGKTTIETGKVLDVLGVLGLRISVTLADEEPPTTDLDDFLEGYETGEW